MKINGKQAQPTLRDWIAVVTLFSWVLAFGVCATDCALGMSCRPTGNDSTAGCHESRSANPENSDSASNDSFCLTIKSLSFETYPSVLNPPDASALFQPGLAWPISSHEVSYTSSNPVRQGQERNWAITLEVHLGPAHLPHGPPILC